jgi:hypothetical protein
MAEKQSTRERQQIIADIENLCGREPKTLEDATENLRKYSELIRKLPQKDVDYYSVIGESLVMVRLALMHEVEYKMKAKRKIK